MRFLLFLLLALPLTASAQTRSNPTGLFLHTQGQLMGYEAQDDDADAEFSVGALGFGQRVGYGFNRTFTLLVGYDAALGGTDDESDLPNDVAFYGDLLLGTQINLGGPGARLVPYLQAGLVGHVVAFDTTSDDDEEDFNLAGGSIQLGGGLRYFLTPTFALDAGLEALGGTLEPGSDDARRFTRGEEFGFGAARLTLGVTGYLRL